MIETPSLLFKQITHGVYVISVVNGSEQNAFTAAWVMQVSFDPPMISFSINPEHYSYVLLKASGVCTVNVLGVRRAKAVLYQWVRDPPG
jgi:flavin reductase (DIM6/NTAB) family NADH-FMN oxidoreductase RutF